MTSLDILEIHNKILNSFSREKANLEDYRRKLAELHLTKNSPTLPSHTKSILDENIKKIEDKIKDIENSESKNFYHIETSEILKKYEEILKNPIKVSFTKKTNMENPEKKELSQKYLSIAKKYITIDFQEPNKQIKTGCDYCGNNKNFTEEDNSYICLECSVQTDSIGSRISYKDSDRINLTTKYTYDRKVHFRDCINQYQGKENCNIDQKVYSDLEDIFDRHYLLEGKKGDPKNIRFKNITKTHISMFLKELGYCKHYENVNLIHYTLTGKKPDDISHLEEILIKDFDSLVEVYDKTFKGNTERINFISTQYVLYQLLKKHKHPCKKEDFIILKTIDRKAFHDNICQKLFDILGWNFSPIY